MSINVLSDSVFEVDDIPEDYGEIAEQKIIPAAHKEIFETLDHMLMAMGYPKMELGKQLG